MLCLRNFHTILLWKDIQNDVFSLMDIYRGVTTCIPRAGDTILLWKDIPIDDEPLSNKLPHMFTSTREEDISIVQFQDRPQASKNFHLTLSIKALHELTYLQNHMNDLYLEPMMADEWITCWGDVQFRPKKFTNFFFRELQPPAYITMIWKTKCIMKLKVFTWPMLMDRVNVRDMLHRRHFDIGVTPVFCATPHHWKRTNTHFFSAPSVRSIGTPSIFNGIPTWSFRRCLMQ